MGSLKKINNLFIKDIFHGYCLKRQSLSPVVVVPSRLAPFLGQAQSLPAREARSARRVVRGRRRRERLAEVAKGP